jgi:hypothetical protein
MESSPNPPEASGLQPGAVPMHSMPMATAAQPTMSAVVPLASGHLTIIKDGSSGGKKTIIFQGSTTTVDGTKAIISGHELDLSNNNAVKVDGQREFRFTPLVLTAMVPLESGSMTVLSDGSKPDRKTIIFSGSTTVFDSSTATLRGHVLNFDHKDEVVIDYRSTVRFQPSSRTDTRHDHTDDSGMKGTGLGAVYSSGASLFSMGLYRVTFYIGLLAVWIYAFGNVN